MTYENLIDSRVRELAENWPTLDAAYGCLNCRGIFRSAVNARCPHCGSESVYDVVAALERSGSSGNGDDLTRHVRNSSSAPMEIEETALPASDEQQFLTKVIVAAGLAETNKEAQRLVAQGGVLVDEEKVDDSRATIDAAAGKSYVLKVGKRGFARVRFED